MPVRKGSVAKAVRQQAALDRFTTLFEADAVKPKTNIRRFANVDQHEVYLVAKFREKAALQSAVREAQKLGILA